MILFKILSRKALPIFVTIAIIFSLIFVFYFIKNNSSSPAANNINEKIDQPAKKVAFGLPTHLKIPSIDIDVAIENVGLTPSGAMAIPKSTDQVGWFEFGRRPGESGSAVIAGHFGQTNGKPSVFDNLSKLSKGDKIYIQDDNGATISFIVRENRSYNPTADATDVFSSDDDRAHLNLITCEGVWNKDTKSYSQRLVVFADKE